MGEGRPLGKLLEGAAREVRTAGGRGAGARGGGAGTTRARGRAGGVLIYGTRGGDPGSGFARASRRRVELQVRTM